MRKFLLNFSASILLGAALVFNTSAQNEKQVSQTIFRASMDNSPTFLTSTYIGDKEGSQWHNSSPKEYLAGRSARIYFGMKNENNETFEGQYGLATASTKGMTNYGIDEIIHESSIVSVAPGESFNRDIQIDTLSASPRYGTHIVPIFKKTGGEWQIPPVESYDFRSFWIVVHYTDLTLDSDITSSVNNIEPNQEFTVSAKIIDNRELDTPESVKVGLFISNPWIGYPVSPSNLSRYYNYSFFQNINISRDGDTFYCKVPDNIPSGKYMLAIHTSGESSIARGDYSTVEYREITALNVNNPNIESHFDYASFSFNLWSTDPTIKTQYKTGVGIKHIKVNTNSVGVDNQGQWGIAISKKANREDIDPATDMVVLHESVVMNLGPNSSYNLSNDETNPIPSIFGSSAAYLYPIFRANASEQWYLSKKPLAINVQKGTTGIEDAENDQTFSVYPNPVVDVLNIKSERSMQSVELYNLAGSMIMKLNNAGNEQAIRMNEYPNGLYIVRIKTNNGTTVKKIKKN